MPPLPTSAPKLPMNKDNSACVVADGAISAIPTPQIVTLVFGLVNMIVLSIVSAHPAFTSLQTYLKPLIPPSWP